MSANTPHSDCVVIGAGPAGLSAARWLHTFEVAFRWFATGGEVGGLLNRVNNTIVNYPGGCYATGAELGEALHDGLVACEASPPEEGTLESAIRTEERWHLEFADRPALRADTVILATGTQYRRLGVPGEAEALGTCVSQSATADGEIFAGRTVAVVGGGDAGFENALLLSEHGCRVWMLLRNTEFKARPAFVERVLQDDHIELFPIPTTVERIDPLDEGCLLHLDVDGRRDLLEVACLFVRIGVDPLLPHIEPSPQTSEGFVIVDGHQRTTCDALFAAGDVTDCLLRSVPTAVGSGARAAKAVALALGHL